MSSGAQNRAIFGRKGNAVYERGVVFVFVNGGIADGFPHRSSIVSVEGTKSILRQGLLFAGHVGQECCNDVGERSRRGRVGEKGFSSKQSSREKVRRESQSFC